MLVKCSIRGGNYLPLIELHTRSVTRPFENAEWKNDFPMHNNGEWYELNTILLHTYAKSGWLIALNIDDIIRQTLPVFFILKQLAEFKLWFVVYKLHLLKSYQTLFFCTA